MSFWLVLAYLIRELSTHHYLVACVPNSIKFILFIINFNVSDYYESMFRFWTTTFVNFYDSFVRIRNSILFRFWLLILLFGLILFGKADCFPTALSVLRSIRRCRNYLKGKMNHENWGKKYVREEKNIKKACSVYYLVVYFSMSNNHCRNSSLIHPTRTIHFGRWASTYCTSLVSCLKHI